MITDAHSNPANLLITDNLYSLYEFFGSQNGCKLIKGKAANWIITTPSCWPNMIYNIRFTNGDFIKYVKDITENIRQKKAPPFWIITPETDPGIEQILENNGMIAIDLLQGMVIDLDDFIIQKQEDNPIPDVIIREVTNTDDLLQWIDIVNRVIFKGKKLDPELLLRLSGHPLIHFYTGFLQDTPVATSMSFISFPSAGFYNIATLPSFRKKGLGRALTLYAMMDAFKKGCKTGILHASLMGEPVYAKIGYKHYGQYKVFWMAGKEFRDF
jgi:GNAT superfamily N-acetyltransferase